MSAAADDFRFALTETLKKSALFTKVQEEGADYRVTAEILSQQVSPARTTDVVLLVQYTLVETHTKTTVFQKSLLSQQSRPVRFADKIPVVVEATVRDSLTQFLKTVAAAVHHH